MTDSAEGCVLVIWIHPAIAGDHRRFPNSSASATSDQGELVTPAFPRERPTGESIDDEDSHGDRGTA